METQVFNGIEFYRTSSNDYFRHFENGKVILMHRYVWEFYNCKIPKGYHIHHIDGNKANNDISNLQLMKGVDHWKLHGRLLTDAEREWRRNNIKEKAIPKAIEWHKSDKGKEWHKQQYQNTKDALHRTQTYVCLNCGKEFTGEHGSKYCCNACKSAYRRKTGVDLVVRKCVVCGKEFSTNKNRKGCCCSPTCRSKYGHRKGN